MIHLIYIYLIINSFIVGFHLNDRYRFESKTYLITVSVLLFLFGGILIPLIYGFNPITKIREWVIREVKFQYRFYLTDYWDKIFLDDDYSEDFKTREEKLKMAEKVSKNSKQIQRHNKQIQKKYATQSTL